MTWLDEGRSSSGRSRGSGPSRLRIPSWRSECCFVPCGDGVGVDAPFAHTSAFVVRMDVLQQGWGAGPGTSRTAHTNGWNRP